MTGSGKTGLCLTLLEEAAIDGIPVIAIDPNGDIGNLLLTFPSMRGEDFAPWVDPGEAARNGQEPAAYAETVAAKWREGLRAWDQDPERIARLRSSADFVLYTPGSTAGRPIALLRSFVAPSAALRADEEAVRERALAAVSGLLALAGLEPAGGGDGTASGDGRSDERDAPAPEHRIRSLFGAGDVVVQLPGRSHDHELLPPAPASGLQVGSRVGLGRRHTSS